MSTLLCARAASAHVPALRRAQLPAEVQRIPPPVRDEHAYAVRVPRSAGAEKKVPPVRGEHACAVRVPRSAGAEKGCLPDRA